MSHDDLRGPGRWGALDHAHRLFDPAVWAVRQLSDEDLLIHLARAQARRTQLPPDPEAVAELQAKLAAMSDAELLQHLAAVRDLERTAMRAELQRQQEPHPLYPRSE